ncbi:hypothetical protein [Sphingomonas montana]|uniref:hypothetical protein n=1 Tax=Sphingomonas montana TaxID=1843236 RepID=UPI00096F7E3B|nr:hypothetical protein [Sphingomonas montana]
MRTMPLVLLLWLAACGPTDPVVDAAPAADTAPAAVPVAPAVDAPGAPAAPAAPAAAIGTAEADTADAPTAVEELAGRWRVTGVEVADGPVSAVDANDPTLMGAVLSVTPDRLAWEPHKGGFFSDTCPDPQIGPDASVGCGEGQFGPPDMRLVQNGDRLRINWYDGAILLLSRVKP